MIFLSETTGLISIKHCRNVSYVTLYQGYASRRDSSRNRGARGRGLFPIYLHRKTLKVFFSETTGPISLQLGKNVSLVTLYQDCSSNHDLSKNMAASGWGLFFLYIYIEN